MPKPPRFQIALMQIPESEDRPGYRHPSRAEILCDYWPRGSGDQGYFHPTAIMMFKGLLCRADIVAKIQSRWYRLKVVEIHAG